jgi:hypothetical protein
VTVPDGGTGTAVVTMSFDYRTRGGGPFITTLGVKHSGAKVPVQPGHMALAPSSTLTATTVRSVVPDLAPGETYKFFVGVNSAFAARGHNSISTSKMVVTVDIR